MKGSTVAGINPKITGMPKGNKGSTIANGPIKFAGPKAKVAPNQNLKLKGEKVKAMGTVQGIRDSIHKNRGGSAMKKVLGGRY